MFNIKHLGAAHVLALHGFDKEASELILGSFVPSDKLAAEDANPFSQMSDQELLHLISLLPPQTKELILNQLQHQVGGVE
jgi:tryptophan synthase alpha subunit